jgi:hypothetical protein
MSRRNFITHPKKYITNTKINKLETGVNEIRDMALMKMFEK